jgi:hypothetical protein
MNSVLVIVVLLLVCLLGGLAAASFRIARRVGRKTAIIVALALPGTILLGLWYSVYPLVDVLAWYEDSDMEAALVGESKDRWEGWWISLRWRWKGNYWMEYYLDRECDKWKEVTLVRDRMHLVVKTKGVPAAIVDLGSGRCTNLLYRCVDRSPYRINLTSDVLCRTRLIDERYRAWSEVLGRALERE